MSGAPNFYKYLVLLVTTLMCAALFANPRVDKLFEASVREMAQELVDDVESTYDCEFSIENLLVVLAIRHYTVVVNTSGKDCNEALRVLQLRSTAFPFRFMRLQTLDTPPNQSLALKIPDKDLIFEENSIDDV